MGNMERYLMFAINDKVSIAVLSPGLERYYEQIGTVKRREYVESHDPQYEHECYDVKLESGVVLIGVDVDCLKFVRSPSLWT